MEVPMIRKLRARMTYANVVSTIALGLAIGGGTAYAATRIGTSDIRYHAVTGSKIASNAVTTSKVKANALTGADLRDNSIHSGDIHNGTLQAADFAGGQLPKGDKGDKGDPATSIFGVVGADGGLTSFKNITGITGTNPYTVTAAQDVSKCAVIATLGGDDPGSVAAEPTAGNVQQFTFRTFGAGGVLSPRPFQFAMYC
jgi:hypothetical protein